MLKYVQQGEYNLVIDGAAAAAAMQLYVMCRKEWGKYLHSKPVSSRTK
jgi:hypothetical protein